MGEKEEDAGKKEGRLKEMRTRCVLRVLQKKVEIGKCQEQGVGRVKKSGDRCEGCSDGG